MEKTLLIDKPAGWTSFDVVAKVRGSIRAGYTQRGIKPTKRQLKVGHAGTLDPFATGLLVILLGDACARAGDYLKLDKTYQATLRLGATSTTGDPDGEIIPFLDAQGQALNETEVEAVLKRFVGDIEQRPPAFSAIKIGGVRAYKLAREGKAVEMPTRTVTIHDIELLSYNFPLLTIRADVSSGTYIRTLAEDIGQALGVGAYCQELRRTRIDRWSVDDAITVDEAVQLLQNRDTDTDERNHQQN